MGALAVCALIGAITGLVIWQGMPSVVVGALVVLGITYVVLDAAFGKEEQR